MNAIVNSQLLAQELRLLNQVAPTKPSLPILSSVLLRADLSGLQFEATDLEIALRTTCQAQVTEPGIVTLPAKRLLDLVEQLPNADVYLTTEKHHVYLRSGAFKGRLQSFPAEDFPALPEVSGATTTLPTAAMQTMIGRVRYAISDKGKYTVNGALFSLTEQVAALVATDGKRLSIATMSNNGSVSARVVIPAKALDALMTMFTDQTLDFSQSDRHLFFVSGERLLVSRMQEAQFPAYERIVTKGNNKVAVVDRVALSAALRRVGLMSEENQACYLEFADGCVTLNSSSAEVGEGAEQVVVQYTGDALKICVNWSFVLDFLEASSEQTVQVALNDAVSPLLFSDGDSYISVIMGMRL